MFFWPRAFYAGYLSSILLGIIPQYSCTNQLHHKQNRVNVTPYILERPPRRLHCFQSFTVWNIFMYSCVFSSYNELWHILHYDNSTLCSNDSFPVILSVEQTSQTRWTAILIFTSWNHAIWLAKITLLTMRAQSNFIDGAGAGKPYCPRIPHLYSIPLPYDSLEKSLVHLTAKTSDI